MRIDLPTPQATCGAPVGHLGPPHQFLDVDGLAQYTGLARATILSDLSRAPWKLPPGYRLPGRRKLLWQRDEVAAWIKRFPAFGNQMQDRQPTDPRVPPQRGRPRKEAPVRSCESAIVGLHSQGRD